MGNCRAQLEDPPIAEVILLVMLRKHCDRRISLHSGFGRHYRFRSHYAGEREGEEPHLCQTSPREGSDVPDFL
jgi:hypothetical protein